MKTERETRKGRKNTIQDSEVERGTFLSMLFSLFLVGLSLLFVFGFHQYLKGKTYEDSKKNIGETLKLDKSFRSTYIIVRNNKEESLKITEVPGEVNEESRAPMDGELIRVVKRGEYEGKLYYELQDGSFLEVIPKNVQEVEEYIPLEGSIAITYISSSGVNIRAWIDFDADNVIRSVYVGDIVEVTAMVVTKDGKSAFRTDDGYYITTDSSYFNDFTNLREKMGQSDEDMSEEDSTELQDSVETR